MRKENRNFKKLVAILITAAMCSVLLPHVSADSIGMVANWNFDEGIGSVAYDTTSNDNDGFLSGGKFGNALEFDGINDNVWVDGSATDLSGMSKLTIEAWVYVHSYPSAALGSGGYGAIVTKWYQSTIMDTYGIWISSGHKLVGALGPQVENGLFGTTDVTLNTWHYMALVYDSVAGTLKLYLDGNQEAIRTGLSGSLNSEVNPLYIGCDYYGISSTPYEWRFFDGVIDEVRISNTAHTISGSPSSVFFKESDTIALWHFDESVGISVDSDSDVAHTGTVNGATWAGPKWSTIAKYGDYAVHFDGVDDYINVPTSTSLEGVTTEVTLEAWIRADDIRNAFYVRTPYDNNGRSYGIDRWGNKLRFYIYDGGTINSYHICEKAWTPTINTWYHICGTFDGNTLKLYKDGSIFESVSYTGDIDPSYLGVVMGARYQNGGADFHKGYLDEVRIYNYALTSEVIAAHADLTYNLPPVANANGPYLVAVGQTITLDGSGSSDPDWDDLTYSWSQTETLGTFDDETLQNPEFTAGALAGVTELTLTVDDGYLEDSDTTMIVVYDPTAGFVTGGGWIDSPAEAYKPDTSLTGKANFGFVSKYKKGQSIPTGNTEFKFEIADLDFHSSEYEWLVITGSNKAMFKGNGTINDEGLYKFMITAQDINGGDTFKIKIWEEDTNGEETVIYDNGTDKVIGGGQIKIHKG